MMPENRHDVMLSQGAGTPVETFGDKPHAVHTESQQEHEEVPLESGRTKDPEKQPKSEQEGSNAKGSHSATHSDESKVSPADSTSGQGHMEDVESAYYTMSGETHESHESLDLPESPEFEFQDANLPLDVDSNETDSAMGDTIPSSTASVTSSLYNPIWEYGRSYHRYRSGKYMLPNDETEQSRLDLQHHMFVMSLHGALHLAPLSESLHNVLDIATGTGIWAIEFAIKYPSANVIGTDLSPIQPQFVPPNCHFEVDDAEDQWVYSHNFDYIHGRCLLSCFKNFPAIVDKAFAALHPGGYFELQDICPMACFDDSWNGTELQRWMNLVIAGASNLGMDWMKATKYKQYMIDAGFQDVEEENLAWASNTWPRGKHHKLLGAWNNQNYMDGIQGFTMRVLNKGLGMTVEEVEVLLVGARKCLRDKKIHCYTPVRVVYGRKPL